MKNPAIYAGISKQQNDTLSYTIITVILAYFILFLAQNSPW